MFEGVISDIDFPPIEALANCSHVAMVIIVPAFAKGEESEEETVSAIVVGGETTGTKNMGEGIDEESAV